MKKRISSRRSLWSEVLSVASSVRLLRAKMTVNCLVKNLRMRKKLRSVAEKLVKKLLRKISKLSKTLMVSLKHWRKRFPILRNLRNLRLINHKTRKMMMDPLLSWS